MVHDVSHLLKASYLYFRWLFQELVNCFYFLFLIFFLSTRVLEELGTDGVSNSLISVVYKSLSQVIKVIFIVVGGGFFVIYLFIFGYVLFFDDVFIFKFQFFLNV